MHSFIFTASVWLRSNGKSLASWHFVSVDAQVSQEIVKIAATMPRKGRGSVKVEIRIGFYTRKTSIFPDKKTGCYLLPIKAEVRNSLHIKEGDEVLVYLTVLKHI